MDKKITARLRAVYRVLEPKWRYAGETLLELLAAALMILAAVLGFLPWLLVMGLRRLLRRMREEGTHGAAENTEQ